MMERLNCTTATSVECFESILKKMFADKKGELGTRLNDLRIRVGPSYMARRTWCPGI